MVTARLAVTVKMWWGRVLRFLHIRKPEDDAPAEPVSAAHESEESEALDPVGEPAGKS